MTFLVGWVLETSAKDSWSLADLSYELSSHDQANRLVTFGPAQSYALAEASDLTDLMELYSAVQWLLGKV